MRARQIVVAALALSAGAASGEETPLQTPPPSEEIPLQTPRASDVAPRVDAYGRLLATPDREVFKQDRVRIDFRAAGGSATIAEPFGNPDPQPHEVQRYFNVDARSTSFVLFRLAPAPVPAGPANALPASAGALPAR